MKLLRLAAAVWLAGLVTTPVLAQTVNLTPTPTEERVRLVPSISDFVQGPSLISASLSPSGRYLVWARRSGSASVIQVRDLETGQDTLTRAGEVDEDFGGIYIDGITWKSDDRLLVSLMRVEIRRVDNRRDGAIRGAGASRSVTAMNRDGSNMVPLRAPSSRDGYPGVVLDSLRNDPDHILMTYAPFSGGLNVARVNVATGESVKIVDGSLRVMDYITDSTGSVVGRTVYRGEGVGMVVMEARDAGGGWTEMFRLRQDDLREMPDYKFLGSTDEPNKVYVAIQPSVAGGDNTAGVHVFDFATRAMGPTIWRNEQYDVSGVVLDADTSELRAGCYWADTYRCEFVDPRQDATMTGIRRFFGDDWSVSVVSQARDGNRWLVRASAPNNPGEYYLFNAAERRMEPFGVIYPRLPEEALGSMRRVDYVASDGQALYGYLTRPPGAAADAVLPLVVMPHGGPEARDYLTYDRWAQFLATRGYQVFQPNFRGSAGMGKGFAEAGYRQWGQRMQSDVSEGVQHLAAQGLADPARVCIMGASYGGYAALQSGATEPDLYRCVISLSGPSDLAAMLRWEGNFRGTDSDAYEYWVKSIGDPRVDRASIDAASPIRRVEGWRPPVLLIHGDRDSIVPVAQSRDMDRALREAGEDVRLVILEGEGHSSWSKANETTALTEIETFLARHLPVASPQ